MPPVARAVYWWRRSVSLRDLASPPIRLSLSLLTKELGIARGRSAAMTAPSETVRMSLYQRIAWDGLSRATRSGCSPTNTALPRRALDYEQARWQANPALRDAFDPQGDLRTFETL